MSHRDHSAAHILIVDDNPNNLQLLMEALSGEGYQIHPTTSGELALQFAFRRMPELILLDIRMPGLDGFEVCRRLQANPATGDIPIIFLSALSESNDKAKAFAMGGVDYITKPFQLVEVLARVRMHLRWRALRRELEAKNARLEREVAERRLLEERLKHTNATLHHLATTDELTQLANRRYFSEYIDREWRRSQRERCSLGLLLCDIDYFKRYNDHYGHQAGDHCLRQVAQAVAKSLRRATDLAARYGGEELAVVLPNTVGEGAMTVAEAIISQVKGLEIAHAASPIGPRLTISVGVSAIVPRPDTNYNDLLHYADDALYRAKAAGRNRAIIGDVEECISAMLPPAT